MLIRQETPADYPAVYSLVQRAFASAPVKDGTEQDLVVALRKSRHFIPQLSLVAEDSGKILGHIMFTTLQIGTHEALTLAPLSVAPGHQRQGVGQALIREGHRIAKALGYEVVILLGSEKYYPKWGYQPASTFGIRAPFPVADENFMAIHLDGKKVRWDAVVKFPSAFGIENRE
ncbi:MULTISPECIES: N-acetyltransferase [unclassified Clostridium]|jgi:predicted N-acetyltransferase YhbS|uniref:GNAT family N-acetyltransferase n=1 Tax=Clostridia TaxID=186801 RepID=UPI0011059B19|nr:MULTISPECIES: N-acetyltransferase [unclassified Clostridium]